MEKLKKLLFIGFVVAFILRLSFVTIAHHGDLNNNISWGNIAAEKGLNGFYGSSDSDDWPFSAPNQPPLTIVMFAGTSAIWQITRDFLWYMNWNLLIFPSETIWFWDEKGMDVLVKLPSIFTDLGIGYLIYNYFKKEKREKTGLLLSLVWLFNPVTWYNSSVWGQTDSIVNLLGFLSIFALLEKKLIKFSFLFTLSLLFKGSLSIFIPILLFTIIRQKYTLSVWMKAALVSFTTVFLTSIWFYPKFDFLLWFINLYKERILPGEIGYLTANAFNFWWLVNPGKVNDNTIYLGLSSRIWGFLISLTLISGLIFWVYKKINTKKVVLALAITSLVTFLFMTRIHERYLYPFFPYATLSLGFFPGMWVEYSLLSLAHLLNMYHLFWVPSVPFFENMLLKSSFIQNTLAIVNIIALFLSFRHLRSSKL